MNRPLAAFALAVLLGLMPMGAQAQDAAAPAASAETPDMGIDSYAITELSADSARRAFDAYTQVQEKFADAAFEDYESLLDFVKRAPQGKDFEAVIRSHGFAGVEEWLPAINAVEFTLSAIADNQEADIRKQIEEVKADAALKAEERDRIVQSLESTMPSANNRKIVEDMMQDPAYAEKLKGFTSDE